ncbi:MAG TPA: hypothetical protein V6D00_04670 [Pantanalinema sp.]
MAFEHLRAFLPEIPLLTQVIELELAASPHVGQNSDEIRKAHDEASRRAFGFLKAERLPYAVVSHPETTGTCPDCGAGVKGAYWELNHPDGKGASIPAVALHLFVAHGKTECREPLTNLSGSVIGVDTLRLDLSALKEVLSGIALPPEVQAELAQA